MKVFPAMVNAMSGMLPISLQDTVDSPIGLGNFSHNCTNSY